MAGVCLWLVHKMEKQTDVDMLWQFCCKRVVSLWNVDYFRSVNNFASLFCVLSHMNMVLPH